MTCESCRSAVCVHSILIGAVALGFVGGLCVRLFGLF